MSATDLSATSAVRPFPGLRPYEYADREFFFGREDQSYALYRKLDYSRFIAVVGSSGSGKSSLVRAGLQKLIDEEAATAKGENGRRWKWLAFRPGEAPISRFAEEIVDRLVDIKGDDAEAIRSARRGRIAFMLRQSSFGVREALNTIDGGAKRHLIVLIDQFEELFRYAGSARDRTGDDGIDTRDQAAHFVQLLLEASRDRDSGVHVIITMRSDFIGDCARFHGLPEAVSASQYLVPALARDEREQAIRGPIEKAGAAIDPMLVQRLLNDTTDELDQLPVLQHCLARIWDHAHRERSGGAVTLGFADYEAVGTVEHALSQHADAVMADLPGLDKVVEAVFRALAALDDQGRITRRALAFQRLCAETGYPVEQIRAVVDRFRARDCAFLTPSIAAQPTLVDDDHLDVGHEALLRRWTKVSAPTVESLDRAGARGGWLSLETEDAQTYRALLIFAGTELTREAVGKYWPWWQQRPRTAAWAERYGGNIDRVERLLAVSLNRARWAWWRRFAMLGLFVLIVGLGVGGYLWRKYSDYLTLNNERQTAMATRAVLASEIAELLEQNSTSVRFNPGSATIVQTVLRKARQYSDQYSSWLREQGAADRTGFDERTQFLLKGTETLLASDLSVDQGHFTDAIAALEGLIPGTDLSGDDPGDPGGGRSRLRILRVDALWRLAAAQRFSGHEDEAEQSLSDAEKQLIKLAEKPDIAGGGLCDNAVGSVNLEQVNKRLARVYNSWIDLDAQTRQDKGEATDLLNKYAKLVEEETAAASTATEQSSGKDAHQAARDKAADCTAFWSPQKEQVNLRRADLQILQNNSDPAIKYLSSEVSALEETKDKNYTPLSDLFLQYYKYKYALALIDRGSTSDLGDAEGNLASAEDVYERFQNRDGGKSWWWLVGGWVADARGDNLMKLGNFKGAEQQYDAVAKDDQQLLKMDSANMYAKRQLDEVTGKAQQAAQRAQVQ